MSFFQRLRSADVPVGTTSMGNTPWLFRVSTWKRPESILLAHR